VKYTKAKNKSHYIKVRWAYTYKTVPWH